MTRRHISFRKSHRPSEPPRRGVDQHQVHRPAAEPVLLHRAIPARECHLPPIDGPHPRMLERDLAAVKPDPAARRAPAVRLALFNPAVERAAGCFHVHLHHRAQQSAEKGQRAPVAVRGKAAHALAPWSPPRSGAMLVLIQVSSMDTSRLGSRADCQDRQRCRRRAISARACSRANSVF